jgi:1,4-alpha-glucan branching enzyme
VIVRALRPEAERVLVVPHGVELEHAGDGVWEGRVPDADLPLEYRLEVSYPDGETFTLHDPYRFLPTIGELDLHLIGEGRHETLYEKLGANPTELDGVAGVAFAVWAPSAASVSVVGDFNGWDGRLHPMRSLGSSGIWELFVPGVEDWSTYRFELKTPSGEIRMKSDPLAFHTETPPANASKVFRSRHEWSDEEWLERRRASEPLRSTRCTSGRGG